jgi:hypothetical protein
MMTITTTVWRSAPLDQPPSESATEHGTSKAKLSNDDASFTPQQAAAVEKMLKAAIHDVLNESSARTTLKVKRNEFRAHTDTNCRSDGN